MWYEKAVLVIQICYVFTLRLKLLVPKPAQHTPSWTQAPHTVILIRNTQNNSVYLFATLAKCQ